MPYVNKGITITVDADLLPTIATALKSYWREYMLYHEEYDRRLIDLVTELEDAAEAYVLHGAPDLITSKQASEVLECTQRYITRIASKLGGIKQGNRYMFPRDLVLRFKNRVPA